MKFSHHSPIVFRSLLGILFAMAWIALLVTWCRHTQKRTDAAALELRGLKSQWTANSARLADARKARLAFDAFADRASRVLHESDQMRWSSALQGIVASTNDSIDLREIRARRRSNDSDGWSLRIAGFSRGAAPRIVADTFRRNIERELAEAFGGEVTTRFEKIEDLRDSGSGVSTGVRAGFTIEAKITRADRPPVKLASGT